MFVAYDPDHLQGGCTRHWVTPECIGVGSAIPVHQLGLRNSGADGHPGRESLGCADDIRLNTPVFDAEPPSSPSHAGLHLVVDHQYSILVKHFLQSLEIVVRWNNIAALALNRLDKHRGNIFWRQIFVEDLL